MEGMEGAAGLLPPGLNDGLDLAGMVQRYAHALGSSPSSAEEQEHKLVLETLRSFAAGASAQDVAGAAHVALEKAQSALEYLAGQQLIYTTLEDLYMAVTEDELALAQAEQDPQ